MGKELEDASLSFCCNCWASASNNILKQSLMWPTKGRRPASIITPNVGTKFLRNLILQGGQAIIDKICKLDASLVL